MTASKVEQALVNAPATVSLIDSQTIASSPATNYADLLRAVPGLNVTQTSARDINLTSRAATGTLSTSQLALVDGRTIYQDFFGFVAWDFLPDQPVRDQADRSDSRPGVGGVGRQRAHRRGQRDHQIAARAGQGSTFMVQAGTFGRDASGVERSQRLAVLGRAAATPRRRQRSLGLQGQRRLLDAGRAGAAERSDPERHRHALSRLHTTAARASRSSMPASTTTRPTTSTSWCSPAGSPAPKASSTPASARSTSIAAPTSPTAR